MTEAPKQNIVLVSGSRKWTDREALVATLAEQNPLVVLHGACPTGADYMAGMWAVERGIQVVTAPAPWARGRRAGPERNAFLLELTTALANHWFEEVVGGEEHVNPIPVLVAAPLPGGTGTQDMLRLARQECFEIVMVPGSKE